MIKGRPQGGLFVLLEWHASVAIKSLSFKSDVLDQYRRVFRMKDFLLTPMALVSILPILLVVTFFSSCSAVEIKSKSDPDKQLLKQLEAAGSDLTKVHQIEFFLYFPSEEKANDALFIIQKEGLDVDVRKSADESEWLCFATKAMVPEYGELVRLRNVFDSVAEKRGGEYDGWGTEIVK